MSRFQLAACLSLAIVAGACRPGIDVRTMAAPDAGLTRLHTFRMLPAAARRDGRPVTGSDDPMISNSIANRAIREQIVRSFQGRGYTLDERNADFVVAFYATAREKLDMTVWDYGYPVAPGWPRNPMPPRAVGQYIEGSVIVDVVTPGTRNLLWRGEGRAELSDDAVDNVKQLAKTADAIVGQFPRATTRVVAVRP